jgi:predicted transcriptional regulator
MPYIDLDIEVYEFVRACSKRDIKELIKELVDEGHLPKEIYNEKGEVKKEMIRRTSSEIEFSNNLDKLKEKYFSLSQEEELFLTKIFNKYN